MIQLPHYLHHDGHVLAHGAQFAKNCILLTRKERKSDLVLNHVNSPRPEHSGTVAIGRKEKRYCLTLSDFGSYIGFSETSAANRSPAISIS